jgi:hypothetical protein
VYKKLLLSFPPRVDDIECARTSVIQPRHAREKANFITSSNTICLKYGQCDLIWVGVWIQSLGKVNV